MPSGGQILTAFQSELAPAGQTNVRVEVLTYMISDCAHCAYNLRINRRSSVIIIALLFRAQIRSTTRLDKDRVEDYYELAVHYVYSFVLL